MYLYYKNVVYFVFPHNQTLYLLRSLYAQYIWMILYMICACYWCVVLDFGTCFSFIHSLRFPMTTFGVFCCVMLMLKFEKRLQVENWVRVKEHKVHSGNMYYIPTYVCRQDCQIYLFFWLGTKKNNYLQEDLNFY